MYHCLFPYEKAGGGVGGKYAGFMEPTLKRHFLFQPPRSSGRDWVGPVRLNREDTHTESSMQRGKKRERDAKKAIGRRNVGVNRQWTLLVSLSLSSVTLPFSSLLSTLCFLWNQWTSYWLGHKYKESKPPPGPAAVRLFDMCLRQTLHVSSSHCKYRLW